MMATYKVHKTKDYTVMSNIHLRNKEMSLKAKGLLSVMLSLPDDWDYSINGLVAISKENVAAIKSTLGELKDLGYLVINKKMPNETESGRIEYEYDIYETPMQAAEKQAVEKQELENQPLEIQPIENPLQLNTNKLNTKELNTNNEIYNIVVSYLNEKAGTAFRSSSRKTQQLIHARLEDGFTVDNFKTVIEKKVDSWKGTEYEQYLRPETLFGTKFESYLNAPVFKKQNSTANEVINGKEYYKKNGNYYLVGGCGVAVDPFKEDDLAGIF